MIAGDGSPRDRGGEVPLALPGRDACRLRMIAGFFGETPAAGGPQTIAVSRDVAAPPLIVWNLITDHENFGEIAPTLSRSEVVSGSGLGMRRRCYDLEGRGWNETCTAWDEGRGYTFEVDTADYPYPLAKMAGTWAVGESPSGSRISMRFELEPTDDEAGRGLASQMMAGFPSVIEAILDHWQQQAEERASRLPAARPTGPASSATTERMCRRAAAPPGHESCGDGVGSPLAGAGAIQRWAWRLASIRLVTSCARRRS